jgi:hypothetical protein
MKVDVWSKDGKTLQGRATLQSGIIRGLVRVAFDSDGHEALIEPERLTVPDPAEEADAALADREAEADLAAAERQERLLTEGA